ncbi:hypothetical protein Bpfe_009362, partial [Biomphalaria pfeifferi]
MPTNRKEIIFVVFPPTDVVRRSDLSPEPVPQQSCHRGQTTWLLELGLTNPRVK